MGFLFVVSITEFSLSTPSLEQIRSKILERESQLRSWKLLSVTGTSRYAPQPARILICLPLLAVGAENMCVVPVMIDTPNHHPH